MSRFPPTATKVGTTERLMQENEVGPDDDDDDKNDDKKLGDSNSAILVILQEP